jgi:transcriptional regulator with XRE-family HTH domain
MMVLLLACQHLRDNFIRQKETAMGEARRLPQYVGQRIRDLRSSYGGGEGLSQEALARLLDVAPNTISRWETGTYKPSLQDLESLSRVLGVSVLEFFPSDEEDKDEGESISALLRAAKQLAPEDVDELRRYAEFRRARSLYQGGSKPKPGRKQAKAQE